MGIISRLTHCISSVWARLVPSTPRLHDAFITQGAKILAKRGQAALQVDRGWGGRQRFMDNDIEALYGDYVWNEIAPGAAIMAYVGMFVDFMFVLLDLQLSDQPNFVPRLASRLGLFIVLIMFGSGASQRNSCATPLRLWMLTCMEICVSALLQVRNLYEFDASTFYRSSGMWTIGTKAGLACFEVGFLRMSTFLAAETAIQSAAHFARPAWNGYPARWFFGLMIWFACNSYYVEHKSRQSFAQKCEFRLAHALAEEAHRLHRLLKDHAPEMICVHHVRASSDGVVDIFARIKYASNSCQQLTGWGASELVNKSPLDFVHVDDATACKAFFNPTRGLDGPEELVVMSFIHAGADVGFQSEVNAEDARPRDGTPSILSLGFDQLSVFERDPSSMEMVPLVASNDSWPSKRGNGRKIQPFSPDPAVIVRDRHPNDGHRDAGTGLTRWRPNSVEERNNSTASQAVTPRTPAAFDNEEEITSLDRNEPTLSFSNQASLDGITPFVLPDFDADAKLPSGKEGAAAPRVLYSGIHLRFRRKSGNYIVLDVTKSNTPEGIVCVYRNTSWKRGGASH